jgi:Carbohydrate family 9 binding domain-like
MSSIKTQWLCALGMLALAGLACGGGTNVQATVDAVDTAVQSTLAAMTQPAGGTPGPLGSLPAPSTRTPQPTLGIATPTRTVYAPPAQSTPTNRPAGPTATTAAGSDQPVRPNGPLLHAAHLASPPNIDAQGNDWPAVLPNTIDKLVFQAAGFNGPFDQSGRFAMGWDANNFYLYVVIADDTFVQTQHGELIFKGDSLELQFDADLAGDFAATTLSGDDYQLGLSPGENRASPEAFLWNPAARKGVPAGITMASRAGDAGGYIFEAAIPWALFNVTPTPGQHFGMALNSSDDDAPSTALQQSMTSSVATRKLLDPTSWGTVQIDP